MQTQELPTDQRLVCSGTSWQQFKSIEAGFSDSPGIRLFYYKGTLEIVSTSPEHEIFKSIIGYLVTTFFILYNLGAEGYDRINRSILIPELDFELLTRCVLMNSIADAAKGV